MPGKRFPVNDDKFTVDDICECMLYVPILTDPSLSPSNLTSALDSLPDTEWRGFGGLMDVPRSTLDKIASQFHTDRERKTEVLRVCSDEHPQPTWEQVSDALYQLREGKYHSVLERVQSQFPTGEYLSVTSHTFHHNLDLPLIIYFYCTCVHVHTAMYTHDCT